MPSQSFDVVIVGAGCAGISAALGLAKAGLHVAVVEAAVYPGAENWSGCVYFCENLADPDLLGPDGVKQLAWERRLVQRGAYVGNGSSLLGVTYRDPETFRDCFTVLRPIFDHHLAQLAVKQGVVLLASTTAESLLRDGQRVIGVATHRGPVYGDLVYLAEGDASHLVSREGYERLPEGKRQPSFLQGIKQVIQMPAEVVERNFGLKPGEGAACEIILRNARLNGRQLRLNMGGFIYTNHSSLSIGLVLPADHLAEHFAGDPNLLLEWFENLPDLKPWLSGGTRGVFGAKLIRGGGPKEFPRMVDHGLAIGGAASGVGVDFPYPNYTGPATRMGLQLVRAVKAIRQEKGDFTSEALERHYLAPLRQTRYWRDVEFLRDWPGYVEKTQVFFDRQVDLILGSAFLWTQDTKQQAERWDEWFQFLMTQVGPDWTLLQSDQQHLATAMSVKRAFEPPPLPILLHDAWLTTLRGWFSKRGEAEAVGEFDLHYSVNGQRLSQLPHTLCPATRRLLRRLRPGFAAAARSIYRNDDQPLHGKINQALRAVLRRVDLGSLLSLGWSALKHGWKYRRAWARLQGQPADRAADILRMSAETQDRLAAAAPTPDLTPMVPQAAQKWEDRLGKLGYVTDKRSHIHIRWPAELGDAQKPLVGNGLWHVCPAHVYEARVSPLGQLQVVVNHENCVKCETCWRTSDLVDWGRDGNHRFIYAVHSPVTARLIAAQETLPAQPLRPPAVIDVWAAPRAALEAMLAQDQVNGEYGDDAACVARLTRLADQLDRKLAELPEATTREPRIIDASRQEHLRKLAVYADRLGAGLEATLQAAGWVGSTIPALCETHVQLNRLVAVIKEHLVRLVHFVNLGHFAWAGGEARRLRHHDVHGLRQLLSALAERWPATLQPPAAHAAWLAAEQAHEAATATQASFQARLDEVWGPYLWRDLDRGRPLTPPQEAVLRDLASEIPAGGAAPLRAALLTELGRRDPSLGYRVALHLLARDIAARFGNEQLRRAAADWAQVKGWACAVTLEDAKVQDGRVTGSGTLVPLADFTLVLAGADLLLFTAEELQPHVQPTKGLGLRGAALHRINLDRAPLPPTRVTASATELEAVWQSTAARDFMAVGLGMADQLTERCIAHATSRVQFPGLFHDERSRDTIGKFGAVKKMVAEMAASRLVIETLLHDDGDPRRRLEAVAYLLCSAPGSVGYNAGQVFGGTGYSEDDILSKFYRDASAWRFLLPVQSAAAEWSWADELEQPLDLAVERGTLTEPVRRWRERVAVWRALATGPRRCAEAVARASAYLYASGIVLARCHARLEEGRDSETELALLDVWLTREARLLNELQAEIDSVSFDTTLPAKNGHASLADYTQFLAGPVKPLRPGEAGDKKAAAYLTGDYLVAPIDVYGPRYVPEMIATDARLRATDQRFHELIVGHFTPRDGRKYERFIEANHRPDDRDLDFCREHGFFRLPIPKALGGAEMLKAEYYSLVMQSNQHADATVSLLIQANTSIGTMPILLARDKDLPKAIKDAAPFAQDLGLHQDLDGQLESLRLKAKVEDVSGLQTLAKQLDERLQPLLRSATFKGGFSLFAKEWKAIAQAAAVGDLARVQVKVPAARSGWREGCAAAIELHAELGLRLEACDLALRWIASGQISAFALTEPSAGSDTARVGTRAKLCSVPVERETHGAFSFMPAAGGGPRRVLDARRLDFRPDGVYYRWSDAAASPIRFDEYDYETDAADRCRYYMAGSERVHFTDVAVLRERDGRLWYDYWELTGAKMWITNGRMSGIMALYAKTGQGVTGFIVDRHAEGLVVGKDEEKMGQNGSPTNELSLQAVRVPKEAVLGLEGRGQVNALETLNVGRAGLSMSSVSQMRSVLEMSTARVTELGQPAWAQWRLERIAAETFTAEAVAFYVIGLFEHKATLSVRIESAAAKMLVGELLHSTIEWGEEIFGRAGQTQEHLIEKRKRDARIVNLYEGTNEIQRFLIAKELSTELLARWTAATPRVSDEPMAKALEELLEGLRQRVQIGVARFGNGYWSNPNLQPLVFHLSEAAAWLLAAGAVSGRVHWLANRDEASKIAVGQAAFRRAVNEIRLRLQWFDDELAQAQAGHYAPVIRAADLLFDHAAHQQRHLPTLRSTLTGPLSILVILEPSAAAVPAPYVHDGHLLESYWALTEADQAALETALRLRDEAPGQVSITAAVIGGRGLEALVREVAAHGVQPFLLQSPSVNLSPATAAAGLATALSDRQFDLILGPAGPIDKADGLLTPLLAAAWSRSFAGAASRLSVRQADQVILLRDDDGQADKVRSLPAAVTLTNGLSLRSYTVGDYLQALGQPLTVADWPRTVAIDAATWRPGMAATSGGPAAPARLDPAQAAGWLMDSLGITGESASPATLEVTLRDESGHPVLPASTALVVVASDEEGRLSGAAIAAVKAARLLEAKPNVLLLSPPSPSALQRAAATLSQAGIERIDAIVHEQFGAGDQMRSAVLRDLWPKFTTSPHLITGERWAELAFARLAQTSRFVPRVKQVAGASGDGLELTWSVQGGKLQATLKVPATFESPLWLTLTDDAEVAAAPPPAAATVLHRWSPSLERVFGSTELVRLLEEVQSAAGIARLSDAEFILDVGAGVGNRDGYEAVIEPLEKALRHLGVRGVHVGGSRKVTEELHILPVDRQIGQSGVSVNPKILLAIGISGAPQHLQYIGPRATIISFNKDAEAPLMTLNQRQARPVVFPVVGDLFVTVPAFTAALLADRPTEPKTPTQPEWAAARG